MTPKDRIRLYTQLAALAAVLIWALLCFFIILSPRLKHLNRVTDDVNSAATQLADMRKEIEDANIAGPPVVGESRFEKFGILGVDEEQLFLSDLIDFCTETGNVLNLVRRADVGRPARPPAERGQQGAARGRSPESAESPEGIPQPTIERVPHNVSYSGTFLSSFRLLRKLESYKRLLTVERMEVTADNRVGYPRLNGTITIDLYLVKNAHLPAVAPQAETAAPQTAPGAQPPASAEESQS